MKWNKRHSENALTAKRRLRIMRAQSVGDETRGTDIRPRRTRSRFTIQIRDNHVGDSLTLNLHGSPWPNIWLCEHGQFSTAKIGKAVALILGGGR